MLEVQKLPNYAGHQAVFLLADDSVGLKAYIAIHRGGLLNPAFGATRLWWYETDQEALEDALKLSRLMSYKSALAGLRYGGAKAVIMRPTRDGHMEDILLSYSKRLHYLDGHFVTGADVGVGEEELRLMSQHNDSVVGLHSDPVKFTAMGVWFALQETLRFMFGSSSVKGHSFAIQGVGKTGEALLSYLYEDADRIFVSDIDPKKLEQIQHQFPKVQVVGSTEIHRVAVDVFSPCALSNPINSETINELRCGAVVGSANSQLENRRAGEQLHAKGVLYAPDYLINAGGLMTVVDEFEHAIVDESRIVSKLEAMKGLLLRIYEQSRDQRQPTSVIADRFAEERIAQFE